MPAMNVPFQPLRRSLYSPDELYANFAADDDSSFAQTTDFEIFSHYVKQGRTTPSDYFTSMMQALHDNSISQSLYTFLAGRKCVAVMGGHKLGRATEDYAKVVRLSAALTKSGFLVASGGGPGAMEATHLGASASGQSASFIESAIEAIAVTRSLPDDVDQIVAEDGSPDVEIAKATHAWFAPAARIMQQIPEPGVSLAVPTWHYGHEPSTPLATHIAKYFQNSIREDGLLAIAHEGVVYAPGKAGTIQEIFQDAAQNYYRSFGRFSPMVFLDRSYWLERFPVDSVLRALFRKEDYEQHVLFTDEVEEAHAFLMRGHT